MKKLQFVDRAYQWGQVRMTRSTRVLVVAVIVGILTGFAAAMLKAMITGFTDFVSDYIDKRAPNYIFFLIPVIGIVLTGILCRYIFRRPLEHGVTRLLSAISSRNPYLSPHLMYEPAIASTVTLAFGGSAGSEGPIAYTGAAIGSNVARWFKMPPDVVMAMMGLGAGAGIAAIFKSPIGGALFTIEVLRLELTTLSIFGLLVACITSAMTAYMLSGFSFDVHWVETVPFDVSILPWVVVLGVFCGFYSYYYTLVMKWLRGRYEKIRNPWYRNIASGLVLSSLIFLFPVLYGEGYGIISDLINGRIDVMFSSGLWWSQSSSTSALLLITGGVMMAKCWATCSSNSGGGVAGDFAPTLFAGCMAGVLFATGLNHYAGTSISVANFALMGMAAVMAGAIRAPMMAIFLTIEMTASYSFFLPVIVASTISFAIVKMLTPGSFYPVRKLHPIKLIQPVQEKQEGEEPTSGTPES